MKKKVYAVIDLYEDDGNPRTIMSVCSTREIAERELAKWQEEFEPDNDGGDTLLVIEEVDWVDELSNVPDWN